MITAPAPQTAGPYALRNNAIVRTDEEIEHARSLFSTGATFRQVRAATGMSMAKLKKIRDALPAALR